MLILPLHKPLTLASFPLATMLLVLANVMVFFGWQAGDDDRMQAAQAYYLQSGLGEHETGAYARHLRATGQPGPSAELAATPAAARAAFVGSATLTDAAFLAALETGALFETPEQLQAWRPLRQHYQGLLDEVFTLRHILRSSEWSPARMLSSAFLHAGVGHLLGNMLFLIVLGLLLEGAVGPARLLAVYVLGALGASAASLLWRWGESGGGLGASGAVAAMMGAFCVVWGRRPVRFFYWFGVVFDYVRAPAIWLLPVWLGWEVYNLLANSDKGIGFDAHAGGLLCGAVTGAVLVLMRQVREDYMQEDATGHAVDPRWERALHHLGRMENTEAEHLLAALALEQPQRADIAVARFRAAANAGNARALAQRAVELLRLPAEDIDTRRVQADAVRLLAGQGGQLSVEERELLLEKSLRGGWLEDAEILLQQACPLPREIQAQQWFRLALAHGEQGAVGQQHKVLKMLVERYPELPQAGKARFLLENS